MPRGGDCVLSTVTKLAFLRSATTSSESSRFPFMARLLAMTSEVSPHDGVDVQQLRPLTPDTQLPYVVVDTGSLLYYNGVGGVRS
ncbi:hypothetical protein J6590_060853 [Homalodisca vitripennis]|nr:hypothetical protein J6590_060853 [Homalodisca vitripennis]